MVVAGKAAAGILVVILGVLIGTLLLLNWRMTSMNETLVGLGGRVTSMNETLVGLGGRVTSMNDTLVGLGGRVTSMNETLTAMQMAAAVEVMAETNEVDACLQAPVLALKLNLPDEPRFCAIAAIQIPTAQLPASAFRITQVLLASGTTPQPPMPGALHCLTRLTDDAARHLMSQLTDNAIHHRVFDVETPAGAAHSPWRSGYVLAYLQPSDFFLAMADEDMSGVELPQRPTQRYVSIVDTVARYERHLSEAQVFLDSGRRVVGRAPLARNNIFTTSVRMTLSMQRSRWQYKSKHFVRLSVKDTSQAAQVTVTRQSLSRAELQSVQAVGLDFNAAGELPIQYMLSPLWSTPGTTPQGSSGGPVYGFDHGQPQPGAHPFQIGLVTGHNADLQQSFVSPLWPTLAPTRALLMALLDCEDAEPPLWRACPLERRALDFRLLQPVDLHQSSDGIAQQVHAIVAAAAVCEPL